MTLEEQLQQQQDKLDIKKAFYQRHKVVLDDLHAQAFQLDGEFELIELWDGKHYARFSLSGDKHKLSAAVRALRTRGFKTEEEPPKKGQSTWTSVFSRHDIDDVTLSFSSTACRLVKVGTKQVMVDQPVYETVCDELVMDELPASAAQSAS